MFRVAFCMLLIALNAMVYGAPPRLIVRGDDMGAAHAVNEAILKCQKEGIQTSIEVIVPSPWFPEAVRMLAEVPESDVGVHLALSSEWDNVKWRPLTSGPSLRDDNGYFYPMIFRNPNYPKRALAENGWVLAEIEAEFRAQIEMARKHIPQLTHLSGHMGCTDLDPAVRQMVRKLAIEYRLDIEPSTFGVKSVSFSGAHRTAEEKVGSFLKLLSSLEEGKTYLFVEHPGLDTPELRAIHHIGYEDVAADRQGVTDLLLNPRVKEAIQQHGIVRIGYRDLAK